MLSHVTEDVFKCFNFFKKPFLTCYLPDHAGVKSDSLISHQRDKICAERWQIFSDYLIGQILDKLFVYTSPASGYCSELFCPLERRSCATPLKPNTILLALRCPEPNAFCSLVGVSSLLSLDSLSTCCPNVHTAGYSNKHTASQAHCFSFQSLCFPPVRALPPPLLQHCTVFQPDSSCSSPHTSQL